MLVNQLIVWPTEEFWMDCSVLTLIMVGRCMILTIKVTKCLNLYYCCNWRLWSEGRNNTFKIEGTDAVCLCDATKHPLWILALLCQGRRIVQSYFNIRRPHLHICVKIFTRVCCWRFIFGAKAEYVLICFRIKQNFVVQVYECASCVLCNGGHIWALSLLLCAVTVETVSMVKYGFIVFLIFCWSCISIYLFITINQLDAVPCTTCARDGHL